MKINYKEIARLKRKEESNREIGKRLKISRNTVNSMINKMQSSGYSLAEFEQMSQKEIDGILKATTREREEEYVLPDYAKLSKELSLQVWSDNAVTMGRIPR